MGLRSLLQMVLFSGNVGLFGGVEAIRQAKLVATEA